MRRADIARRARRTGLAVVVLGAAIGAAIPTAAAQRPVKAGPTTTTTTTAGAAAGGTVGNVTILGSSGGGLFGAVGVRRLGVRSPGGGLSLRVYQSQFPVSAGGNVRPECFPDRQLLVELSSPAVATGLNFVSRHDQPYPPSGQYAGYEEGQPIAVVVAMVPKGSRQAVMRFNKGQTDAAVPLAGGWVVLASRVHGLPVPHRPVPLLTDVAPPLGQLTVVDAHGHRHSMGTVSASGGFALNPNCFTGTMTRPTTPTTLPLPQPTGPPPADPTGAQRAIEAAYRGAFGATKTAQGDTAIDGGYPLDAAGRAELQKSYGDLLGKLTVRVNALRFLSPTEAALSFDLLLNGQPITAATVGRAVLVNGQWKVARATFCDVVMRGGVRCT